MTWNRY